MSLSTITLLRLKRVAITIIALRRKCPIHAEMAEFYLAILHGLEGPMPDPSDTP